MSDVAGGPVGAKIMFWIGPCAVSEALIARLFGLIMLVLSLVTVFTHLFQKSTQNSLDAVTICVMVLFGVVLLCIPDALHRMTADSDIEIEIPGGARVAIKHAVEENMKRIAELLDKHDKALASQEHIKEYVLDVIALQSIAFDVADTILNTINKDDQIVRKDCNVETSKLSLRREELFDKFRTACEKETPERQTELRIAINQCFLSTLDITEEKLRNVLTELDYLKESARGRCMDRDFLNAIRSFQEDARVRPPDGIFGPATYRKLLERGREKAGH